MKFRKKPVVIEAMQFTDENKDRVLFWAKSIQMNLQHSWDENNNPIIKIPTLEGEMICAFGDWLIAEPFPTDWRKIYPCKPDIFEKTYEPADAQNPTQTAEEIEILKAEITSLQDDRTDQEEKIRTLWEYADHKGDCRRFDVGKSCTCGFATIRASRPTPEAKRSAGDIVSGITNDVLNCYADGVKVSPVSVMKTAYGFILKAIRAERQEGK